MHGSSITQFTISYSLIKTGMLQLATKQFSSVLEYAENVITTVIDSYCHIITKQCYPQVCTQVRQNSASLYFPSCLSVHFSCTTYASLQLVRITSVTVRTVARNPGYLGTYIIKSSYSTICTCSMPTQRWLRDTGYSSTSFSGNKSLYVETSTVVSHC